MRFSVRVNTKEFLRAFFIDKILVLPSREIKRKMMGGLQDILKIIKLYKMLEKCKQETIKSFCLKTSTVTFSELKGFFSGL